jgi:hypothetical protein
MDPISIIVIALATGAAAGLKPTAESAIKDAYEGIKTLIRRRYGREEEIDLLEKDPASKNRQGILKEELQKTEADKDEELLRQAQALLDAVQKHSPEAARGAAIDLEHIKAAASVNIEDLIASGSGATIRISDVDAGRDANIRGLQAGGESLPPKA